MEEKLLGIMSYHGTEFENAKFFQFFAEHGIIHNPKLLSKIGFLSGKKIMVYIVKTMSTDSRLSKNLWAEMVNSAYHVTNGCLIWSILNKTPYELLK